MKVIYQRERHPEKEKRPEYIPMPITSGPAFCRSKAGKLTHRIRRASVYRAWGPRVVATFWCGGTTHTARLFSEVDETHRFCHRCEAVAVATGQKPAADLLGWKPQFCRQVLSCQLTRSQP